MQSQYGLARDFTAKSSRCGAPDNHLLLSCLAGANISSVHGFLPGVVSVLTNFCDAMPAAEDERTQLEGSGPWLQVGLTPLSGDSVALTVDLLPRAPADAAPREPPAEEKPVRQRQQLSLAPRSKPVAHDMENWEMGAGGAQWGGLNVDASRKKKRCAECTRPLTGDSLLCSRCSRWLGVYGEG